MASVRQVWRCSASERGSCLACRVSSVACCDSATHLHGGGFAAVLGLEVLGELADAVLDGGAPRRPARRSSSAGDADDFADRALARVAAASVGEPHAERGR